MVMKAPASAFKSRGKLFIEITDSEAIDFISSWNRLESLKNTSGSFDDFLRLNQLKGKEWENATRIVDDDNRQSELSFLSLDEMVSILSNFFVTPSVTRLVDFSPIELPLATILTFWKDEVEATFWVIFFSSNFLHFHINKQFQNMVCCWCFKV